MKPEEAIKILEIAKSECEWTAPLEYQEAFDAAIKALEKQIPKKPEKCIEYGTLFELHCPTCDTKIGYGFDFCGAIKKYNDMKNCIHCGQAIDWTEGE